MKVALLFALAAELVSTAHAVGAAECQSGFSADKLDKVEICQAISTFARCIAEADFDARFTKIAEAELQTSQSENGACELRVSPTVNVVDRKLRFVTAEDVTFERFRRDVVGIFELKEMIGNLDTALTDTVSANKVEIATVSAAVTAAETATDVSLQAIQADLEDVETIAKDAATKTDVTTSITALEKKLAATEAKAAAAADPLKKDISYWFHSKPSVLPTNQPSAPIHLIGVGFGQYFNPLLESMFECTFNSSSGDTVVRGGKVVEVSSNTGSIYHALECMSPSVTKKTRYTLSVDWVDADGKKEIPFQGTKDKDTVVFTMTWTSVSVGATVEAQVSGMDVDAAYQCEYTQGTSTKFSPATFVEGSSGKRLDCGKQPTAFDIIGAYAAVDFKIKKKGTTDYVEYAGEEENGFKISLPTCSNGIKDGAEADVDCGAVCADSGFSRCKPMSLCDVSTDCADDTPCTNKAGGAKRCNANGPGLTQDDPGLTCKGIKNAFPNSKNGLFWIIGRRMEFKENPQKVYCWNTDRDGGGWTYILRSYYAGHQSPGFSGNGITQTGSINTDPLCHICGVYKMDDSLIRAVLGQKDHTNNDRSLKNYNKADYHTKFDYMMDQSGYNSYHSGGNREYMINRDYTARWFFYRWEGVYESSTKTEMTSYKIAGTSNWNGRSAQGEGTVMWKGQANCGQQAAGGAAGVNCNNVKGGVSKPRVGRGCKENLGHNRCGDHQLHVYMCQTNHDTYLYLCNGCQHSSSNRFSHRTWIKTSKDDTYA